MPDLREADAVLLKQSVAAVLQRTLPLCGPRRLGQRAVPHCQPARPRRVRRRHFRRRFIRDNPTQGLNRAFSYL